MNAIQDRHLRFAIAAQVAQEGNDTVNRYLTAIAQKMGGPEVLYFSSFNPNGRYRLDLSNEIERRVAKNLIVINKGVSARIVAKEICDRSKKGNQSCFRNETINGYHDKDLDFNSWAVPQQGIFKFDFVSFGSQPTADQASSDDDIQVLLEWFENAAKQLNEAATKSSYMPNDKGELALDESKVKVK